MVYLPTPPLSFMLLFVKNGLERGDKNMTYFFRPLFMMTYNS